MVPAKCLESMNLKDFDDIDDIQMTDEPSGLNSKTNKL